MAQLAKKKLAYLFKCKTLFVSENLDVLCKHWCSEILSSWLCHLDLWFGTEISFLFKFELIWNNFEDCILGIICCISQRVRLFVLVIALLLAA